MPPIPIRPATPLLLATVLAACGARTGLLGDESPADATPHDASVDVPAYDAMVPDAAPDAVQDVSQDPAVDVPVPSDACLDCDAAVVCQPSAPAGALLWVRRAGGSGWDVANGVAVAPDGTIAVTGNFSGYATFGPGEPGETSVNSVADHDLYTAAYEADGPLSWVRAVTGPSDHLSNTNSGNAVDVGANGVIVVGGEIEATATFGPGEPTETVLVPGASMDVCVAGYGLQGDLRWAVRAGGAGNDKSLSTAGAPDGSYRAAGWFQQTATFGPGEAGQTTLTAGGGTDAFVASFGSHGELIWAKGVGGVNDEAAWAVAAMPDGSTLAAGVYAGDVTFGAGEPGETTLSTAGPFYAAFVERFDANGGLVWVRALRGNSGVHAHRMDLFPGGGFVVTGTFDGDAVFGEGEAGETTLTSLGSDDVFLARFDDNGFLLWATRAGGDSVDWPSGLAVGPGGDIYVTGDFEGEQTTTFGADEKCQQTLTRGGGADMFIARFASNGALVWLRHVGGTTIDDRINYPKAALAPDGTLVVAGTFSGAARFGEGETNETWLTSSGQVDLFVAKFAP